jgi:hydrogenase-4 component F
MLAYSSVEHMGILALGVGIGGVATFGAMLHVVNHSLTKAMLFLAAGNILAFYHTKSISHVRGVLRCLPVTGVLWLAGFLAIVGSPPFGAFLSELTILQGAIDAGRPLVAVLYLLALAVVFIGMATIFMHMAYGRHAESPAPREPLWSTAPVLLLGLGVLVLGVYVPPGLTDLLHQAVAALGVK